MCLCRALCAKVSTQPLRKSDLAETTVGVGGRNRNQLVKYENPFDISHQFFPAANARECIGASNRESGRFLEAVEAIARTLGSKLILEFPVAVNARARGGLDAVVKL